jgi:SAM-dependent methyltransferase
MLTYSPAVFDVPDEASAKWIILTPEGRSTEERWAVETPGLAVLALAALGLSSNSLVLDYGCGIGRLSKALIERVGCRVVGVDISAQMRAMAPDYVASDLFEVISREELLNRPAQFDAALAIWVLQHCHQPVNDCEFIRRSLKPDGRLMVVNNYHRAVPTVERPWVNDGFDVAAHLASVFQERERGDLPGSLIGEALSATTFWAPIRSGSRGEPSAYASFETPRASSLAAPFAARRSPFQNPRFDQRRCFHHSLDGVRTPLFTVAIRPV